MKMAKASKADLDMALDIASYCDAIDRGHMPDALSVDSESIEWIDTANREQYARLIEGLRSLLAKGSISRVIWGMAVICDPANKVIDPNASTLEIHPYHTKTSKQRDELLAALEFARDKIAELHIAAGDGECHYPMINDAIDNATVTCAKCNTPDLCREYGRACDPYDLPEISVPAIVSYPTGSLGEAIDIEGGAE